MVTLSTVLWGAPCGNSGGPQGRPGAAGRRTAPLLVLLLTTRAGDTGRDHTRFTRDPSATRRPSSHPETGVPSRRLPLLSLLPGLPDEIRDTSYILISDNC